MTLSKRVSILEPQDLQQMLESNTVCLIQVTSNAVFSQAHIQGAIGVEPQELVCGIPPATGRLPDRDHLQMLFARIGYRPDLNYVLYDDEGGGWAGRFAWTLDVIGHDGWQYLNGGLHAWHAAGLPLVGGTAAAPALTQPNIRIDSAPIAEIPDVLAAIEDPEQQIWDARSAQEYIGLRQSSARAGHIPGAVNLDWLDIQDPSRQLRLIENPATLMAERGIDPSKAVITHCQTHHRSALTYMLGRLLGMDIRAYHGSWSEWGNRQDTPVECP